jgi:hypothetical protein
MRTVSASPIKLSAIGTEQTSALLSAVDPGSPFVPREFRSTLIPTGSVRFQDPYVPTPSDLPDLDEVTLTHPDAMSMGDAEAFATAMGELYWIAREQEMAELAEQAEFETWLDEQYFVQAGVGVRTWRSESLAEGAVFDNCFTEGIKSAANIAGASATAAAAWLKANSLMGRFAFPLAEGIVPGTTSTAMAAGGLYIVSAVAVAAAGIIAYEAVQCRYRRRMHASSPAMRPRVRPSFIAAQTNGDVAQAVQCMSFT